MTNDDASALHRTLTIDRQDEHALSWTPAERGGMELHAHALRSGDDVWLLDPFDGANLDELLAGLGGRVRHVVVLLDRHMRDAGALARRHGATVHVVAGPIRQQLPSGATRFDDAIGGAPFEILPVRSNGRAWQERALWWPEHALLYVPESLGSSAAFTAGTDNAIATHPALRLLPPRRAFAGLAPRTILFGHGPAVEVDAPAALERALAESRRRTPQWLAASVRGVLAR